MVLSSVGIGASFLVSVILGFGGCLICGNAFKSLMIDKLDDMKYELDEVKRRRQKTKG